MSNRKAEEIIIGGQRKAKELHQSDGETKQMKLESDTTNRCTEEVKTKTHVDTSKQKVTKLNSIKQKSGEKTTAHKFSAG